MNRALATGATDLIGIARPLCVEPALPRRLLKDPTARARPFSPVLSEEAELGPRVPGALTGRAIGVHCPPLDQGQKPWPVGR